MTPQTAAGVVCLVFGLLCTAGAVTLWSGHSSQMRLQIVDFYIDDGLPRRRRGAYFSYPFFAIGWLAGGALMTAASSIPRGLVLIAVVLTLTGFGLGFLVDLAVPAWSKPRWFRAEEAAGFPIRRSPEAIAGERMTLVNWMALAACAVCVVLSVFVASGGGTLWLGPMFAGGGAVAGLGAILRHRRIYGRRSTR